MDENQTQITPIDNTQASETTQTINTNTPVITTDSTPSDMPSEPQNGLQDAFTTPSNEDSSVAEAMEDKQNGAVITEKSENTTWIPASAGMTNAGENNEIKNSETNEAFPRGAERPEETPQASVRQSSASNINSKSFLASLLSKMKEKLSFRTEKRLAKIMELANRKAQPSQIKSQFDGVKITNDDVQKLLRVSDASAGRYLAKLVQRGSLRIVGAKNHEKYSAN